jgi:hypothetical protein
LAAKILLSLLFSVILILGTTHTAFAELPTVLEECQTEPKSFGASDNSGGTSETDDIGQCVEDSETWFVGFPDPYVVSYNPTAGPWIKQLRDANPSNDPNDVFPDGFNREIHEWIEVGQGQAWSDWHEKLLSPYWQLNDLFPLPPADTFILNPDGTDFEGDVQADCGPANPSCNDPITEFNLFFEPPLEEGSRMHIAKGFLYDHPTSVSHNGPLLVEQYPTVKRSNVGGYLLPIDFTMVLLAGTHSVAAWMIPVIVSGIGFAIVISRKF